MTRKVAQNPHEFEELEELDDSDKDIIRFEYAHRWSHPMMLYVTVFLCSVGAATQLVFHSFIHMPGNITCFTGDGTRLVRTVPVSFP